MLKTEIAALPIALRELIFGFSLLSMSCGEMKRFLANVQIHDPRSPAIG